jgi:hypothetical protein
MGWLALTHSHTHTARVIQLSLFKAMEYMQAETHPPGHPPLVYKWGWRRADKKRRIRIQLSLAALTIFHAHARRLSAIAVHREQIGGRGQRTPLIRVRCGASLISAIEALLLRLIVSLHSASERTPLYNFARRRR